MKQGLRIREGPAFSFINFPDKIFDKIYAGY